MSQRKIPGFTILELIVSMILASIIISFSYRIYENIHSVWTSVHTNQERVTSALQFKEMFDRDLEASDYVMSENASNLLLVSSKDTIQYAFTLLNITRLKNNHLDSFMVSTNDLHFTFLQDEEKHPLIKEIQFNITEPFALQNVVFTKCYTSKDLMYFH